MQNQVFFFFKKFNNNQGVIKLNPKSIKIGNYTLVLQGVYPTFYRYGIIDV